MASAVVTATTGQVDTGDCLARVQNVAPIIGAAAEKMEQERRLVPEVLSALHDARLFRLLLPRPYGGDEIDPVTFFKAIYAVAEQDASTAWCLCQGNGCAMAAAYAEPAVANKIWGEDPNAVLAWGPGKAEAQKEGDGYRVNGKWSFASGMRHATWLGGHSVVLEEDGTPREKDGKSPVIRTMLMPAGPIKKTDIWDVIGLRATASDAFEVADAFVEDDFAIDRENQDEKKYDSPLYLFPQTLMYASGFSGTAQGIARGMLDAFKELAGVKTPRKAINSLRDNGVVQAEVAQCEARLKSARAYVVEELTDIWEQVVATNELTMEQRMRIRLCTTYGIHEAKDVADMVYDQAGATAIFKSSAFERRFRDLHTVTQQIQGRKEHFQTVGAYLLGHPPHLGNI